MSLFLNDQATPRYELAAMSDAVAADAIALLHAAYVGFVVGGQLLIVVGVVRRWQWVRNPWFRLAHLAAIGLVVVEVAVGKPCVLFTWENGFRRAAGQAAVGDSFISRWVYVLLRLRVPHWAFEAGNVCFGVLVLATFIAAPPRLRRNAVRDDIAAR